MTLETVSNLFQRRTHRGIEDTFRQRVGDRTGQEDYWGGRSQHGAQAIEVAGRNRIASRCAIGHLTKKLGGGDRCCDTRVQALDTRPATRDAN